MRGLLVALVLLVLFGCGKNERDNNWAIESIQAQITDFYTTREVQDYEPLAYSELDTISLVRNSNGTISSITGILKHQFKSRDTEGVLQIQTDEFEVQLYEDDVVVVPLSYWFRKDNRNY